MLSETADLIDAAFANRLASIIADHGDADTELVDPPHGLWDRIAASIAEEPDKPSGTPDTVEYFIDADDRVITVGEDWAEFATANDAPELAVPGNPRTLWSYFGSDEIRDVWRLLIERVRAQQAEATVPLRCDAPNVRRWFEMTITPQADGGVRFRSVLLFEEPRPAVALLDTNAERDNQAPAVPVCSWCGNGHDGTHWLSLEELVRNQRLLEHHVPPISYGICPVCRTLMSAELVVPDQTRDDRS